MTAGNELLDLVSVFRQSVAQRPHATAVLTPDSSLDFLTLDAQTDRFAAGLAARGVKKGDRVGLYCINAEVFPIAYLSIVKAGASVVPVNLLLPVPEIAYILNDAEVSQLIYHPLFAENAAALRKEVPSINTAIALGDDPNADSSLAELLAGEEPVPAPEFDPMEDVVSIIYTSGTTGRPKGAMLTHRNLVANTRSVYEALTLQAEKTRLLVVLPLFHSFAQTVGMLTPLLHGCTMVPVPKFDPHLVADTIAQTKATVFMGVPTMYQLLLGLSDEEVAKFATLRFCIAGGASMPLPIMEQFESRFGKPIHEGDGPTECSPVTCVNPIGGVRKPGSVGLPVPNVEMSIRDGEGNDLPAGELGEISVRGPNIMKGYWKRPEDTAESFFADWYRTGDIGQKDEDGYFYIVDRLKDMIIVSGMNVYPKMIEDVIYQCPGVKEVAVVSEPDELRGEIPAAHIVCEEGSGLESADIRKFCKDKLAAFQLPRKVYIRDALPKTPTGKILKRELRKLPRGDYGGPVN
jgi:long-chain acyl-CoA synthetase